MNWEAFLLSLASTPVFRAFVVELVQNQGVSREAVLEAHKAAMTAASDEEMRREFPDG